MKKVIIIILTCFIGSFSIYSQKFLILKNGEKITAKKIYRVLPKDEMLKYVSTDGAKKEIRKADLFCMVNKKTITVIDDKGILKIGKVLKDKPDMDPKSVCSQAVIDAIKNYKTTGPVIGTGVAAFLETIPVGLVTAIIISSTPPSERHLNMDKSKATDAQYCDCYKKEALQKKKLNTWAAFTNGWCLGILAATIIIIY